MRQRISLIYRRIVNVRQSFMLGLLAFLFVILSSSACTPTDSTQVSPDSECRMIQHAEGETCVPNNPQRIVDLAGLDYALSLGVKPIASNSIYGSQLYLQDRVDGIADIGRDDTPSLERIIELKPDLIIVESFSTLSYDLLSNIAPTVLIPYDHSGKWKEVFMRYAEILDKTEQAQQVMSRYGQRLKQFQQQMGTRVTETEVSIVRVYPTHINLYLKDSFCGTILADAGLSRPSSQNFSASEANTLFGNQIQYEISRELIPDADGDAIFLWTFGHRDDIARQAQSAKEELKADPLWSTLTAVQQDQVYEVPGEYWIGDGPIAANLVIDDLFKYLVESPES